MCHRVALGRLAIKPLEKDIQISFVCIYDNQNLAGNGFPCYILGKPESDFEEVKEEAG